MNNKGQTAVEYILMMAVIASIILTIVTSDAFRSLFGEDSRVFLTFKNYIEHTYRHSFNGEGDATGTYGDFSGFHDSYTQDGGGDTRFFLVKEPYGQ